MQQGLHRTSIAAEPGCRRPFPPRSVSTGQHRARSHRLLADGRGIGIDPHTGVELRTLLPNGAPSNEPDATERHVRDLLR